MSRVRRVADTGGQDGGSYPSTEQTGGERPGNARQLQPRNVEGAWDNTFEANGGKGRDGKQRRRCMAVSSAWPYRERDDVNGRIAHERQLHQLGGLKLELARPDPAPRAIDAHTDVRDVGGENEDE